MTSPNHSLATKYSFKMAASKVDFFPETNFFRIAGTLEAESLVSGKAECLLAIGGDKKSKLFGVTSSAVLIFFKFCFTLILRNGIICCILRQKFFF